MCNNAVIFSQLFSCQTGFWRMRNSCDTYAKHFLPNQADEHLDSKVTSLYYCMLYTLFFKGTVLPLRKNLQNCYSGEGFCSAQDLSGRLIFAQLCAVCVPMNTAYQSKHAEAWSSQQKSFIPVLLAPSSDNGELRMEGFALGPKRSWGSLMWHHIENNLPTAFPGP